MGSTLEDVSDGAKRPLRMALRAVTLAGLTAFLLIALLGAFEKPAHYASPDGVVQVDSQASVRSGNNLEIAVTLASGSCERPVLTLDRAYLDIIDNPVISPAPGSESSDGLRIAWVFDGSPSWVRISGSASTGWSPPVRATLSVDCGDVYDVELTTTRVP